MNESIVTDRTEVVSSLALPPPFQTIVYGGLTVGVLDCIAASVNAGIKGITPDRVWHYVASALIGLDASYNGGVPTLLLGILLHFTIAFGVATGFYFISRTAPALLRHAVIVGMAYGIAVYFAMGYLIVPLTYAPPIPFSMSGMITGIVIHMFCVGLPVAIWAKLSRC